MIKIKHANYYYSEFLKQWVCLTKNPVNQKVIAGTGMTLKLAEFALNKSLRKAQLDPAERLDMQQLSQHGITQAESKLRSMSESMQKTQGI